jgi:hypothetical protein
MAGRGIRAKRSKYPPWFLKSLFLVRSELKKMILYHDPHFILVKTKIYSPESAGQGLLSLQREKCAQNKKDMYIWCYLIL